LNTRRFLLAAVTGDLETVQELKGVRVRDLKMIARLLNAVSAKGHIQILKFLLTSWEPIAITETLRNEMHGFALLEKQNETAEFIATLRPVKDPPKK
ncbi:MAG: hypothetical protein K2X47_03845, partial [Bdellovibrionales bacterium]|nr:hypothetical protein [Bdellovibrionales bacterium]